MTILEPDDIFFSSFPMTKPDVLFTIPEAPRVNRNEDVLIFPKARSRMPLTVVLALKFKPKLLFSVKLPKVDVPEP